MVKRSIGDNCEEIGVRDGMFKGPRSWMIAALRRIARMGGLGCRTRDSSCSVALSMSGKGRGHARGNKQNARVSRVVLLGEVPWHAGALVFRPEKWCAGTGVFSIGHGCGCENTDIGQKDRTVLRPPHCTSQI